MFFATRCDSTAFQGVNPWVSGHVKQTPHDPNMIWASNQYLIVFKVKKNTKYKIHDMGKKKYLIVFKAVIVD